MNLDDNRLSPDEVDQLIESCAQRVIDYRLAVPVIFFLELHKPLSTLAYTGAIVGMPILAPLFGPARYNKVEELVRDRSHIERLIAQIEQNELSRRSQPDGGR